MHDVSFIPSHRIINAFDDVNDQGNNFNDLFLEVLNHHKPVKMVKIRSNPNPFITLEICQLIRKRDQWHKLAVKAKDPLESSLERMYCFRQEVERDIRIYGRKRQAQILDR